MKKKTKGINFGHIKNSLNRRPAIGDGGNGISPSFGGAGTGTRILDPDFGRRRDNIPCKPSRRSARDACYG